MSTVSCSLGRWSSTFPTVATWWLLCPHVPCYLTRHPRGRTPSWGLSNCYPSLNRSHQGLRPGTLSIIPFQLHLLLQPLTYSQTRIAPQISQSKESADSNLPAFHHQIYKFAYSGSPFSCPDIRMEGVTLRPELIPPLCSRCFHCLPPQGPHCSHLDLSFLFASFSHQVAPHLDLDPTHFTVSILSPPILWKT